jgi:Amt family ammonium transporter
MVAAVGMDSVARLATLFLFITGAGLLLLVVGIAFFYGGLGGRAGAIRTVGLSVVTIAVVVLVWIAYGYGAVFGPPLIPHVIGQPLSYPGLHGLSAYDLAFAGFECLVAAFAVVLVLCSRIGRVRLVPWIAFVVLWLSFVYIPVAYGVLNDFDGWAGALLRVNDFAGGIAVQVNAGAAALALAVVLGRRTRGSRASRAAAEMWQHDDTAEHRPHNRHPSIRISTPLTMVGAALLWFGWLGLDAGSEAAVDGIAALAWVNTVVAPASGMIAWLIVQAIRERKPTFTGAAFGAIAGLAAVSPACNCIAPGWAIVLGAAAAIPCVFVVEWDLARRFLGTALPVVGINLVAGLAGTLFVGLFGAGIGIADAGNFNQLVVQALSASTVLLYSFGATWVIAFAIDRASGLSALARRAPVTEAERVDDRLEPR